MILNSQSVELIRVNAARLATAVQNKEDLAEIATATNYEQVLFAIESLLTNTDMYFDDELLMVLDNNNWRSFKSLLMIYTLNIVNKRYKTASVDYPLNRVADYREYVGASTHV